MSKRYSGRLVRSMTRRNCGLTRIVPAEIMTSFRANAVMRSPEPSEAPNSTPMAACGTAELSLKSTLVT